MAKQHFYSCVPAKMSLFNRMDGYDTFAHSAGLTRQQIEQLFAPAYEHKPTKEDAVRIANGTLPPVYCQYETEQGELVQSTIGYIRSDYTGERSAFTVHSLLLSDEERKKCIETPDAAAFNPKLFQTSVDSFDLVSPDAKPDADYPELAVKVTKAADTKDFVSTYDTGMLKRLIYALIGISCGKTKALFLSLPSPMERFSTDCLSFINSLLQIFPYHMRGALSFVTYTGDYSKFTNYKIRFVPENMPPIPTVKGVSIKMGIKDYAGISDENIAANAAVVDFFYHLLTADEVRRAFIEYCAHAVEAVPALAKPTLKNLGDLVFLFRTLSGFFEEKTVLPNDDAVYSYIAVYEKNRQALLDDYRSKALNCLWRYPKGQLPVPKNVFAKVCAVYPDEPDASRQTVMSVVLELIHTDAMREKLFNFIKSNYDSETAQTKAVIMQDLCRVYYGGFLQDQILGFVSQHFADEPEPIRATILERLLLTIRTPKVQPAILQFVETFYDRFTEAEKERFYAVFYEMLPDGDALSRALATVVDAHIEDERKPAVAEHVLSAIEADEKHREPKLCAALATVCGFTEQTIAGKVFGDWSNRKIVDEFSACVAQKPLTEKLRTIREIWTAAPNMPSAASDRLFTAIADSFQKSARLDLFELIGVSDGLDELKNEVPTATDFVERLQREAVWPCTAKMLPTVFDIKRYPDGLSELAARMDGRPYLTDCAEFGCVAEYRALEAAIQAGDAVQAVVHVGRIEGKPVRQGAAEILKKTFSDNALTDESLLPLRLALGHLKNDTVGFADAAAALYDAQMKRARANGGANDSQTLARSIDENVLVSILSTAMALYCSNDLLAEVKDAVLADNGELFKYITAFLNKYEKKGKKTLQEQLDSLHAPTDFSDTVQKWLNAKRASGGFFKRLFK